MTRILQGHPDHRAPQHSQALASADADGAREGGHELGLVKLGEIEFPLLRSQHEWSRSPCPPSLQQAQEYIHWAEHLVVFFPLWLGDMPALLKRFLEQFAQRGFAFGTGERQAFSNKGLTGRPLYRSFNMRWKFPLPFLLLAVLLLASVAMPAQALPLFARQTGQNCVACHAGGQFPELTPYGRLFKITGYTIGQRTTPLSAMVVAANSRVANTSKSDDPSSDFQRNGQTILATASLFLGGKVTDNIGAFAQITHDPYAAQDANGNFHGRTTADNIDLRFADRFIDPKRDLIVGLSVNNNPSISDPWNTAAAWMQYVPVPSPTSSAFIDGAAPYPSFASGGNIAGINAYAFLNRTIYAELGVYGSSRGALSFMHGGLHADELTKLRGPAPYWRLAWNHEWGPHALMIGTSGMTARIFDNPLDTSDPATVRRTRDLMVDTQYQYLLDPHSVTAQLVYARSRQVHSNSLANQPAVFVDPAGNALPNSNAADVTNLLRAKFTYVYQAKYGGSMGFFNLTGTGNTANQTSGFSPDTLTITSDPAVAAPSTRVFGNLSGNPGTRGATLEAFWMPIQYVRVGAQYTAYSKFNGASSNYDGFGRNARDNNSLFLYVWAAY